ncbi:MAG TPA: glycosyltransferase family 4 protein [Desulfomonilaceae bacterium]|nr:glycosyltransferase family 4 protein [Desulfomonilaceae bacterium]
MTDQRRPGGTPIKFCMLTHSVYSRDVRVRRYAEYLGDEGHTVHVICLRSEDTHPQSEHPNVTVYPIPMTRSRSDGLAHIMNWAIAAVLMFMYTSWLDFKYRYDLIHVHNMPDFLVFAAVLPRLRGCLLLLNIHDPTPELTRSKLGLEPDNFLIRVQIAIERICILFSSHVITATPAFRTILLSRGIPDHKISVVMNAADPRFFSLDASRPAEAEKKDTFILLYVGTVAKRYGLDTCVKALPTLRERIPGIELKIFPKIKNEGEGLDSFLSLAHRLGVRDLVHVHDPVPLAEMKRIMREADLGIYPALQDCHMDIALSLKIPEMVSVGLPIVATRLSVLEELYGDEAIAFVPSGDPVAFAERVIALYNDPEKRTRLLQNALKRAEGLTWKAQYREYRGVLNSMLDGALERGASRTVSYE